MHDKTKVNVRASDFVMVFSCVGSGVAAASTTFSTSEPTNMAENKVYSTATLEDNFDERHVLVVMSNASSLANLVYAKEDFSEISCKSIRNLMQTTTDKVSAKLSGKQATEQHSTASEYVTFSNYNDVNTVEFHQILSIELAEPGKEQVLATIKELERRTDVLYAGPNYIYSLDTEEASTRQLYVSEPWDPLYEYQWAIDMINLPDAWDVTVGHNRKVVVGVVDTGIDASHPDLEHVVNVSASREIDTEGNR